MKQTRTSMKLEVLGQHVQETLKNELHFLMHELIKVFPEFYCTTCEYNHFASCSQ